MTVDNARQMPIIPIARPRAAHKSGRIELGRETLEPYACRGKIRLKSQFSRQSSQQRRAARRGATQRGDERRREKERVGLLSARRRGRERRGRERNGRPRRDGERWRRRKREKEREREKLET